MTVPPAAREPERRVSSTSLPHSCVHFPIPYNTNTFLRLLFVSSLHPLFSKVYIFRSPITGVNEMTDSEEFCPSCGVMAMITYASQGKFCCAICGTEVDKQRRVKDG